ncbi:MAG: hypothetical protein HY962_10170 [Ignavibacteriae bacterium]|nr:hypothetical protein [Ignavibacteriota bacterium]
MTTHDALPPDIAARCADAARCGQLYEGLLDLARKRFAANLSAFGTLVCEALGAMPDPERALVQLSRFLNASFSPGSLVDDCIRRPLLLDTFFRLVTTSGFLADVLVRDAELYRWLIDSEALDTRPAREDMLAEARDAWTRFTSAPRRVLSLRRYQRRELLRIGARDILRGTALEDTVRELSWLADAVVQVLLAHAIDTVKERQPGLRVPPLVVLALGKWGGEELNYSSDIDFVVFYEALDEGDTEAVFSAAVKVVEYLVRLLTEVSTDGMFYRADLRLRPDGAAGPLAMSADAAMSYYAARGALWERQMLLKARCAAGDAGAGARMLERLRPFVHPRTLAAPPSQIAADIRARLSPRWGEADDVKHGRGGIRDIEFAAQFLQLIAGATPDAGTGTLAALDTLADAGRLSEEERDVFARGYRMLRRVEHMVQLESFEQTHRVPRENSARAVLAWKLGYEATDEFTRALEETRAAVARCADAVLGPVDAAQAQASVPGPEALRVMGFRETETTARALRGLREGRASRPHDGAQRARMSAMFDALLADLAREPLPDAGARGLEALLAASPAPRTVAEFLSRAPARRLLLRLASAAPGLLRALGAAPLALEGLFSGSVHTDAAADPASFKLHREAAYAAAFLLGELPIAAYASALGETADACLQAAMSQLAPGAPFLVLAMGKYGGCELAPGSDLDVIFLYRETPRFGGDDAQALARAVIHALGPSALGAHAYEVDARLRPEGRSSPLATSFDAYRRYFDGRASLWEKQSLLKARAAAGDAGLAAETADFISGVLHNVTLDASALTGIVEMRRRMEPVNRFRQADFFDVKLSQGGLVDAEFAVQVLQLAAAGSGGALRTPNSFAAIDALPFAYPPLAARAREAAASYAALRALQAALRLTLESPSNLLPDDRSALAAVLGYESDTSLVRALHRHRACLRALFDDAVRMAALKQNNGSDTPERDTP